MKKFFTLIILCLIAFNTIHAEITWTLSNDGTLTISGTDMPNYVVEYEVYAPWFSQRDKIKKVIIENGVTNIGNYAFAGCSSLSSISIPNSVTSIGNYAFTGCSSLSSISIPNSVKWIGTEVFQNCSNLTSATISMNYIVNNIFKGFSNLKSVTFSNTVTSIGEAAFADCSGLTSVTIPNSVTSIGRFAFQNCSKLTSITIPNSVTSIGNGAFGNCSALTSITNHSSVTSIGNDAFHGTKWYDNQPDGFVYVGSILYNYKGAMPANVVIKDGTKEIPASLFYGCSGLTSITIPNSVISIGDDAFHGCSGLTSITIPNSVTSIGNHAFESCYKLKKITIGNSIESIGDYAFYSCYNIQSITIAAPEPPSCANTRTFKCEKGNLHDAYDVYNYATLHVPMGSKEAYSSAYEWRYFPKIKEDMEIDGKVYYAKLSVKQGTTGYTEQPVKADETYTIYIGALGNSKINAVTFNGEDVTDQVKDGYYTTPEIKAMSVLSISYEDINTTNVKEISNPDLKVTGNEDEIKITGIEQPTNVEVYTMDGKLVETRGSAYGDTNIQVKEDNLYVVKVGKRAIKIAM